MIERLVATLLLVTIGYCAILNRRLKRLKADERVMRSIIGELAAATERAERSIAGLKLTVQDCDQTLGERLRMAERLTAALEQGITAGERALGNVTGRKGAARQVGEERTTPDAKAVAAAAQAFAERARTRTLGRAA
jgi:Domain of unknown function (DUF6468)